MRDITKGLAKELYELCAEIEKLPASEQQTACIVKASDILHGPYTDPDNYVAWLRFHKGTIQVCDSDSEGAFRVYRRCV